MKKYGFLTLILCLFCLGEAAVASPGKADAAPAAQAQSSKLTVKGFVKDDKGEPIMGCPHGTAEAESACIKELVVSQPGTQDAQQFAQTARDITAFLEYAGEPAALKRESLGVWVILFLVFLAFLAWLLKNEYWQDVH